MKRKFSLYPGYRGFHPIAVILLLAMTLLGAFPVGALTIAVETTPQEPRPGQQVQTRLLVGNPGNATAADVRLELVYPEDFSTLANNRVSDGGNCSATGFANDCRSGEPVVWHLGDIASGATRSVYLVPQLSGSVLDGQVIDFDASASIDGALDTGINRSITVRTAPVLALALESDADPVVPGEELVYTLHYAHRGPSATSATELRFPLPAGTSFVDAGGNGTLQAGEVVWDLGVLNPGEESRRSVTLALEPSLVAGDLLKVDGARISGEFEFETIQASSNSTISVGGAANPLAVAIRVGDDAARPGAPAWIQITASNRGSTSLQDLAIELLYPEGLATLANNRIVDGGNCSATGFAADCRAGEPVVWNLGTLVPGGGKTVMLAPFVANTVTEGRALVFQARVGATGEDSRWARQIIRVDPGSPLRLGLAARIDPVAAGADLALEISYGNSGDSTASGSVLELPLPPGVSPVEISDGGQHIGDRVVWDLGLLDPGEFGRPRVLLALDEALSAGDLLRFERARLSGTVSFFTREAHARAVARVADAPALDTAITLDPNPALDDQQVPAEIVVTNRTDGLLTGVTIEMLMPETFRTLSNSLVSDGGNCAGSGFASDCRAGEPVIWELGNLPPGQGRTVRLQPITSSALDAAGFRRFEARVRADAAGERWSRQHLSIGAGPGVVLNVDASASLVPAGGHVDYLLSFANPAAQTLSDATLSFPLPGGTELVEAEGATLVDERLEWPIPLLGPGENDARRARLAVAAGIAEGRVLDAAEARLAGAFGLAEAAVWARSAIRVETPSPLAVEIDLAPNPVAPGERLLPRLSVANRSTALLTRVQVDMPFPDLLDNLGNAFITAGGNCSATGFSSDCRRAEPVVWDLGTLPPGSGRTFWLPPRAGNSVGSGELIRMRPRVVANRQRPIHTQTSVPTRADRMLELAMEFDPGPEAPGAATRVRLHFGNRSDQPISEAVLRLPLPGGVQATGADGNGVIGAGEVFWDIGPIPAGRVGQRELNLLIDADAGDGMLIRTLRANLTGFESTDPVRASADGTLRVAQQQPLAMTLDFAPEFAAPGMLLSGQLTITNRTAAPMPDVTVEMIYPEFLANLPNSNIPDGGNCSATGFSSDCRGGEPVQWALGTLGPGETRMLTIEPTIRAGTSGPSDGSLIRFFATADNTTAGQADARATVLVGDFLPPPPVPVPQIALSGNGQPITNGSTSPDPANGTDFGTADIDSDPRDQVYVITNAGNGPLELTGSPRVAITGAQSADFMLTALPSATIEPGQSASLTIRFQPDNLGPRQALVTIDNNVAGETPYTFSIAGEGLDTTGQLLFKDGFE